jgi:hypothetical protein
MKAKSIFLSLLLAVVMLQGCGSKSSSSSSSVTNGSVRLVNATTAYASLDLITSGTTFASAVATGSASAYASITPATYTFSLDVSGSGIPAAQQTLLISSGVNYALVAHTVRGQLQLEQLTEMEPAPASGDGKIRVSNLALQDTGAVDVYMTGSGGTLASTSALVTNFSTSGYFEVPQGTYHIWVTGVGNKADLRLDLPSVAIANQQIQTLVLTSTTGGALVDGWLVSQAGAVIQQANASARIRVAANISASGTISATANSVALDSSTLMSPAVDSYVLVPAGPLSLSVVVSGTTVNVPSLTAAPGADLTLLAVGTVAAPKFVLLSDDNTLPLGGKAKLRLVNGVNGLASPGNVAFTVDANLVAQNVLPGTASTAATIATTGNPSSLQVSVQGNPPPPQSSLTLQSQGVYSVFELGDNAALVGIVRADR